MIKLAKDLASLPSAASNGDLAIDQSSGMLLMHDGINLKWVPIDTVEWSITVNKLTDHLGCKETIKILTEEIIERRLREEDSELNKLWKEYKTLAKLKTEYIDLDELLKE